MSGAGSASRTDGHFLPSAGSLHDPPSPRVSSVTTMRFLLTILSTMATLCAQDRPHFEVASVKAVVSTASAPGTQRAMGSGGCRQSFRIDRSRVDMECVFLPELIGYAFRVPPGRIDGPA